MAASIMLDCGKRAQSSLAALVGDSVKTEVLSESEDSLIRKNQFQMNKKSYLIFCIVVALYVLCSCQKDLADSTNMNDTSETYVCGVDGSVNVAAYWKNGLLADLFTDGSTISGANAIAVYGSDVYVVGYVGTSIKYWKNNKIYNITDGNRLASARSITISGSDIYIGGFENNHLEKKVAKIWKNGIPTSLSDGTTDAVVQQVVVANGDVYAVGFEETGRVNNSQFNSNYKAVYWKNGIRFDLTDGTTIATANSIFIDGSDIYVVGERRRMDSYDVPILWKNGIGTELTDATSSGYAASVYVSNGDVHILGREGSWATNIWNINYWKNGNLSVLGQGRYATAKSIIVKNNDVYILYHDGISPILLKNENKIAPFDGSYSNIQARGIFIR